MLNEPEPVGKYSIITPIFSIVFDMILKRGELMFLKFSAGQALDGELRQR